MAATARTAVDDRQVARGRRQLAISRPAVVFASAPSAIINLTYISLDGQPCTRLLWAKSSIGCACKRSTFERLRSYKRRRPTRATVLRNGDTGVLCALNTQG